MKLGDCTPGGAHFFLPGAGLCGCGALSRPIVDVAEACLFQPAPPPADRGTSSYGPLYEYAARFAEGISATGLNVSVRVYEQYEDDDDQPDPFIDVWRSARSDPRAAE